MLVEEGVGEKTVQRYSLPMVHSETAGYQVPGGRGERVLGGPEQVAGADLLVRGVGDVPAQHVVQQNTQRPDGQFVRLVFPIQDPLGWTVDSGAVKVCVNLILQQCTTSKIYQTAFSGLQVKKNIFVLYISMDDAFLMTRQHCFCYLFEEILGKLLFQSSFISDKIE